MVFKLFEHIWMSTGLWHRPSLYVQMIFMFFNTVRHLSHKAILNAHAVLLCIVMCWCIMYYNGLYCTMLLLVEARVYSIKRYSWFKFSALYIIGLYIIVHASRYNYDLYQVFISLVSDR